MNVLLVSFGVTQLNWPGRKLTGTGPFYDHQCISTWHVSGSHTLSSLWQSDLPSWWQWHYPPRQPKDIPSLSLVEQTGFDGRLDTCWCQALSRSNGDAGVSSQGCSGIQGTAGPLSDTAQTQPKGASETENRLGKLLLCTGLWMWESSGCHFIHCVSFMDWQL